LELEACSEELRKCKIENEQLRRDIGVYRARELVTEQSGSSNAPDPLLTDLMHEHIGQHPLEFKLQDVVEASDEGEKKLPIKVFQFAPMQPGETLQEHVQRQVAQGSYTGPESEVRSTLGFDIGHCMHVHARQCRSLAGGLFDRHLS
jgi:hypothetical protein